MTNHNKIYLNMLHYADRKTFPYNGYNIWNKIDITKHTFWKRYPAIIAIAYTHSFTSISIQDYYSTQCTISKNGYKRHDTPKVKIEKKNLPHTTTTHDNNIILFQKEAREKGVFK